MHIHHCCLRAGPDTKRTRIGIGKVDSLQGATDKQRKDFCNSRLNTLKGASSDLYNGGGKYVVSFVFDVGGPELDCDMVILGPASLQQAAVHAKHSMRALLLHERSQQGMAAIANAAGTTNCTISDLPTQTLAVLVEVALDAVVPNRRKDLPYGQSSLQHAKQQLPWLPAEVTMWQKPSCSRHPWSKDALLAVLRAMVQALPAKDCIAVRNAAAATSRRFSEARPGDDILVEKAVRNLLESVGKGALQSWCCCASLVTGMHGMSDL